MAFLSNACDTRKNNMSTQIRWNRKIASYQKGKFTFLYTHTHILSYMYSRYTGKGKAKLP